MFSKTRGLKLSIQIAFFSMSIVSRSHFGKIEQVERRKKQRKKSSIKYIYTQVNFLVNRLLENRVFIGAADCLIPLHQK